MNRSTTGNGTWKTALTRAGLAAVLGVAFAPAPVAAQYETRLALDQNRPGDLWVSGGGGAGKVVPDILKNALIVENRSSSPVALVMFAFRVSGGRVASRFVSRPFTVKPGATVAVGDAYLPPGSAYGGKLRAGPEDFVGARQLVPAEDGLRSPERHVANGIFFDKPADYARRDAMYLIVVPADRSMRAEAKAYPIVVFLN